MFDPVSDGTLCVLILALESNRGVAEELRLVKAASLSTVGQVKLTHFRLNVFPLLAANLSSVYT